MAPDVRVVTFNAAAGNPRITTRQADFLRLPFYREALESNPGAPLLALQEVGDEQAAALRRTAAARNGRVLQMRRPKLGNALVIPDRYLVLSHRRGYYVVPQVRGILDGLVRRRANWRQFGELRMWIEARLRDRHAGRDLTLLTTHISADGSLKVPQTKAIVNRARAAAARGPVVLAGDFNVPARNPRGRDVEAAALIARLRDVGTAAPPRGRENIDYVLTAGFEPVSSRLWTGDSLSLPGSPNAETVSDHYAEDDVVRYR
jgi:endonuclease/exonuclease/phosphatase family metal-dependent hydrolase